MALSEREELLCRFMWQSHVILLAMQLRISSYLLFPNSASMFWRTFSLIRINGGHGLLNPSPDSLLVASIPSFVPIAISEVE